MRRDDDKRQLKNYQSERESGKLSGNLVVPKLKLSCRIVKTVFHATIEKIIVVINIKIWPDIERNTIISIYKQLKT